MNATVHPGPLSGRVAIPASKSHTIRALLIAALAQRESTIRDALDSRDTAACVKILRQLGVRIDVVSPEAGADAGDDVDAERTTGTPADKLNAGQATATPADDLNAGPHGAGRPAAPHGAPTFRVAGAGGTFSAPDAALDCENSGTTLYLAVSIAALQGFPVSFTGDEQLQRRSAGPLLRALETLGATVTREGTGDCVPFTVRGPIKGGRVSIECPTSQYLSSLLLAAPLTSRGMEITVPLLNERPYVELTLDWLTARGVRFERDGWDRFTIPGRQDYEAFNRRVPADFSSATFFLVAAAMGGDELVLEGPDVSDSQGDKEVVSILERLGAHVRTDAETVTIRGPRPDEPALSGGEVDLNAIPDALPALAVLGTRCATPLRLVNVPQAREKETDRIAVMASSIRSLGGKADELSDGLVIHPAPLAGGTVDSAGDHRVAMALAVAGLTASGPVTITNAQVADITFPGFYEQLARAGATVETETTAQTGNEE